MLEEKYNGGWCRLFLRRLNSIPQPLTSHLLASWLLDSEHSLNCDF